MDFKVTNFRPAGGPAGGTALREAGDSDVPPPSPSPSPGPGPSLEPASGQLREAESELDLTPAPNGRRSGAGRPYRVGRKWTWIQLIGGLAIAAICVTAVIWYVPRVMSDDRGMLTGAVTSGGVVTLNFQSTGVISAVKVQANQPVRKGQVLAVEYAPNIGAIVAADGAAISAVQAKIAELKTEETDYPATVPQDQAQIAAEKAQLAMDQAQMATDSMRTTATEIVAPAAGVIVAANGQPGEAVTSSGIRDYSSASQQVSGNQEPAFSLLPEGPQSTGRTQANGSSLPVIALRVSFSWSVVAFIPEARVSGIKVGRPVTVSVPAVRLKDVRGHIQEVLPTPVQTSTGLEYQAIVAITSTVPSPPLDGMAANIEFSR